MTNFLITLLTFASISLHAQKKIQKEIEYDDQSVEVELDFASSIELISWDNPKIQIIADIQTENEKYTDLFRLGVENRGNELKIGSNSKEIFEAYQEDQDLEDKKVIYSKGLDHEFRYKIYIPKNIKLDISSITGTIASDYLEGVIKAHLINGDIVIKKFKGDLKLDTVNGKMELPAENASVKARTVMGKIHTNSDLAFTRKDKFMGEEVELQVENTQNLLDLHTVNGQIILN